MPAPQAESSDELDKLLRRALSQLSYPGPAQQDEARASVLRIAARQATLSAPGLPWWPRVWLRTRRMNLFVILRRALTDDSVYHRAQSGCFGRPVSLQYSPSVHFQPMW